MEGRVKMVKQREGSGEGKRRKNEGKVGGKC